MDDRSTQTSKNSYQIVQPLLLSVMVGFGIFLGYKMNDKADGYLISKVSDNGVVSIGKVDEVMKYIQSKYVDDVDTELLEDIAIETILSELDPHSVYIKADIINNVIDNMNGSYFGLGLETIMQGDTVIVVRVLPDSPAEQSGIARFDRIIQIDTVDIVSKGEYTIDDIRKLLKSENKSVRVKLLKPKESKIITLSLKPAKIKIYNADIHYKIDETTGIIKVNQFSTDTYKEFMQSLDDLTKDGKLRNLMIDLRGNPGGYLPEATKILNQLIIEGDRVMVSTIGRSGNKREYKTNGKAFYDIPNIAVFVDEESASGSEIIAGCLQDWDRAVVIGRKTFGKGLVQEQFTLSDGSAIRLTTSKYFLPSGRNIQRKYDDLEEYYDSNYQRMKDSSLFIDKSMHLDSANSKYKSLAYGRFLVDKDGIDPDIFIPLEGDVYDPEFLNIISMTYSYSVKLLSTFANTNLLLANESTLYNNFLNFCKKENLATDILTSNEKLKKLVIQRIKKEIKELEADSKVYDYSNDPFVEAALNYFKNPGIARLVK